MENAGYIAIWWVIRWIFGGRSPESRSGPSKQYWTGTGWSGSRRDAAQYPTQGSAESAADDTGDPDAQETSRDDNLPPHLRRR
ncbi:MAG: hypothetical protein AAB538_03420 [Patescibacteria group bacterium]